MAENILLNVPDLSSCKYNIKTVVSLCGHRNMLHETNKTQYFKQQSKITTKSEVPELKRSGGCK